MRRKGKSDRGTVIMRKDVGQWWLNKDENGKARCVCERRLVSPAQVEIELAAEGWVRSGKTRIGILPSAMTFRVRRDRA